ncbi:MAG: glucose-6-phosphate isomerase [Planctomycetales bacterium]|nr:glucose-6-phosphate isomerase [Planctomycetales bacterium]
MSDLLRFDPSGAFLPQTGLEPGQVDALAQRLEAIRDDICFTDVKMLAGELPIPSDKQPLDAGFYLLPERLLSEYEADRSGSELARILAVTKRLMSEVDRVVVLGIGGSFMGARALMDSCCQPYFNELTRGERGSRPRIYFEGNNVDNDASQGLLHLLGVHRQQAATNVDDAWGLVVISKSGGTMETAAAFRQYLAALQVSCGGNEQLVRDRLIPVTGDSGKLHSLATQLGCPEIFPVPDGVGGRFSVLSAVGLVPAALMGINVMKLLEGARSMNEHFRTSAAASNIVLQFTAVNHLLETHRGAVIRILSVWSKALETAGLWYDQLLAESLGKDLQGAMPLTMVNTRDLHSRHQQHQEGRRDKVVNNVIVENYRFDPLPIGSRNSDVDALNDISHKTLPEVMSAAIQGTNQALREDGRPTTDLFVPKVDEFHMGQFFQMLMLATVVEGRLMGINPYGQPGVEAYKKNMNRLLGRK